MTYGRADRAGCPGARAAGRGNAASLGCCGVRCGLGLDLRRPDIRAAVRGGEVDDQRRVDYLGEPNPLLADGAVVLDRQDRAAGSSPDRGRPGERRQQLSAVAPAHEESPPRGRHLQLDEGGLGGRGRRLPDHVAPCMRCHRSSIPPRNTGGSPYGHRTRSGATRAGRRRFCPAGSGRSGPPAVGRSHPLGCGVTHARPDIPGTEFQAEMPSGLTRCGWSRLLCHRPGAHAGAIRTRTTAPGRP